MIEVLSAINMKMFILRFGIADYFRDHDAIKYKR
jgi:hypothetical protein